MEEARDRIRPSLPVRLMTTADWSNYMNFDHFVPLDSDPHGGDATLKEHKLYDYNWGEKTYKSAGLPTAEVIETGEFLMWWDRCNYKKYDEATCKWFINLVVSHEARHYDQWRGIALAALNAEGVFLKETDKDGKSSLKLPSTLADLESYPAAKESFLKQWKDVAHYQCREVEVYSLQILNGEMHGFEEDRIPYLDWYADKCEQSQWAEEFLPHIQRTKALHTWWFSAH